MKKILSLFILCTLIVACNKKATAPATPAPTSTSTTPPLSAKDSVLLGKWIMDSVYQYNSSSTPLYGIIRYSNPAIYYLQFDATNAGNTFYPNQKKGILYNQMPYPITWEFNAPYASIKIDGSYMYLGTTLPSTATAITATTISQPGFWEVTYYHK